MEREFKNLGKVTLKLLMEKSCKSLNKPIDVYEKVLENKGNTIHTDTLSIKYCYSEYTKVFSSVDSEGGNSAIENLDICINNLVNDLVSLIQKSNNVEVSSDFLIDGNIKGRLYATKHYKDWINVDSITAIEKAIVTLLCVYYYETDFNELDKQAKDGTLFKPKVDTTAEFKRIVEKIGIENLIDTFGKDMAESIVFSAGMDKDILYRDTSVIIKNSPEISETEAVSPCSEIEALLPCSETELFKWK